MKFAASMFWAVVACVLLLPISWGSWCPPEERNSLLQFKKGLHDPSGILNTWSGNTNCCEWEGIQCRHTGHVIRLDLHNPGGQNQASALGNLTSDILSPLFDLTQLEGIDLSYNAFRGVSVPPELGRLNRLCYLNLSNAGFMGDIPKELGNMSKLQYLDLSTYYYRSDYLLRIVDMENWIGNMKDLRQLFLDGVDMTQVASDQWARAISTMHSLRRLQMSHCKLAGSIPSSLGNLTLLTHLRLDSNPLYSPIPAHLQNLSNLVSLSLSDCYLNGTIPFALLGLPKLQEVDLSANLDLGGNLSTILPQHSASLNSIVLSITSVEGPIPASIGSFSSLILLDLSSCSIKGKFPPTIANLSGLVKLDLSMNSLEGKIPPFGVQHRLTRSFPLAYIDLSYNQLDGSIPPMLLDAFQGLRYVDLSWNHLTGTVPSPGGKLNSLTWLDLSNNGLTGKFPSLGNLTPLVRLDLSNNLLSDTIPPSIGQLLSLTTLDLSNNELEGVIPINITKLSKLKVLSLSSNRLRGNLSQSHLHNLSRLVYLDISNNMLTVKVSPTWIPKTSFATLKLSSCNIEGELPAFLITQDDISYLDLSNNRLTGNIPLWIWDFPVLAHLNLSINHFTGDLPSNLMGPKKLKVVDLHGNNLQGPLPLPPPTLVVLDLSGNQFSASIPAEIGQYYLSYLSLSHNNISGSIPPSICGQGYMQILVLSNNSITGKIPGGVGNCANLEVLNLEMNYLEGELPAEFGDMTSLQTLKVGQNRLNGSLPTLVNCKSLQILDVGHNQLTGNISNWIVELRNLKILVLRSNKFEGRIPAEITKMPFLQILDLSMNNFSGAIPDSISELTAMANDSMVNASVFQFGSIKGSTYVEKIIIRSKGMEMEYARILSLVKFFDLSNNNMDGPIPIGMGSLIGLRSLNISRNHFTGLIPESLGNMVQLESLDLSRNQLSGNIPAQLINLTYLGYLDMSYNNLSGKIPQGGQFSTFDASSFSNNSGLCGLQLNASCLVPVPKHESMPMPQEKGWHKEGIDSFIVLVGMSFGIGAAIIIAPLLFLKKCRRKVFDSVDRILIWAHSFGYCDKSQMAEICEDDEDRGSSEDRNKLVRFCVRCTQIDRVTKRIVHAKCTC